MRKIFLVAACVACLIGCKSSSKQEDLEKVKENASREISQAKENVSSEKAEAAQEINKAAGAGDESEVQEEKIEGTKEIANAESKVDDRKVEGTEAVEDARKETGVSTGSYQRE